MINPNIKRMLAELKQELPENVHQRLDLTIYDINGNEYSEGNGFQEKIFRNMFINYVTDIVSIRRNTYSLFDINTDILIEQEDLAAIGKVLSIAVKHLSKIEFEELA